MASKAVRIDLGDMAENAERYVRSGDYESIDEVVQEGLRALDRQTAAFEAYCRKKVQEALDDPRPPIPLEEALAELDRRAQRRREG